MERAANAELCEKDGSIRANQAQGVWALILERSEVQEEHAQPSTDQDSNTAREKPRQECKEEDLRHTFYIIIRMH